MLGNTAVSAVQYKLDHGRESSSIPGPKFFNFGLFLGLFNAENFSLVVNVSELFMLHGHPQVLARRPRIIMISSQKVGWL